MRYHETNETIDDIRRKNFLAKPSITDQLLTTRNF
jgi:hypothetical protein